MNIQQESNFRIVLQTMQKNQRGAATILMAVVLLFAITIISIFTARTTIMEQTISGNEYRGKQAFEAAEAGLQAGIAYFNNGGPDQGTPGTADVFLVTAIGQASYHFAFCDPDPAAATPPLDCRTDSTTSIDNCTDPTDPGLVMVYSCGWSDDRTAVRTVSQIVRNNSILQNTPNSAYTGRGIIEATGNATIINNYTVFTIWSGQPLDTFGSFDTEISVDGEEGVTSTVKSGATIILGPDVISNDSNLSTASETEFFQNFFGKTKNEILLEAESSGIVVDVANGDSLPNTADSLGMLIYVIGDITINDLGSADEPVILVVDGILTIRNNANIYGLVYANDLTGGGGNSHIYGAVLVENDADLTGNLKIEYAPDLLDIISQNIGSKGAVSGSWHDWL